jgi:hypothetical protein
VPNVFVWNQLAWLFLICLAVLSGPLMALAYKVRHGNPPIPMEPPEFWTRSVLAGLGVTGLQIGAQVVGSLLVSGAELPVSFAGLVVAAVYLPLTLWFLFKVFVLEDVLQAIGLLVIFALLSALTLVPLLYLLRSIQMPSES